MATPALQTKSIRVRIQDLTTTTQTQVYLKTGHLVTQIRPALSQNFGYPSTFQFVVSTACSIIIHTTVSRFDLDGRRVHRRAQKEYPILAFEKFWVPLDDDICCAHYTITFKALQPDNLEFTDGESQAISRYTTREKAKDTSTPDPVLATIKAKILKFENQIQQDTFELLEVEKQSIT